MHRRTFLKGLALTGGCAACSSLARASGNIPWNYAGDRGPEKWGDLNSTFRTCSLGAQQSPINITGAIRAQIEPLKLDWKVTAAEIVNNGHTIQLDLPPASTLTHNGRDYSLVQFHFHAPSEHQIDGRAFPMEIHFVHKHAETGDLAVLGVLVSTEGGEPNIPLSQLSAIFPRKNGQKGKLEKADVSKLLPPSLEYYTYEGSLTTPPCSEIVTWFVLKTPLIADPRAVKRFTALYKGNARPVVPTNRRLILESS
ncbi:carbonic anhydrase [Rhizobium sp. L1K21]|uniref:carbonic anhydrase n=1 Tax=Rhizobium sp. L1K21 TaxID=2954933 RepID=UPI002093FA11|nr:carbonic anhydrase family protein [Rhizobium sp. L1K21]MCO6186292.1 carbonic anhydrase family protein [Rhizobium sp. L1K21]